MAAEVVRLEELVVRFDGRSVLEVDDLVVSEHERWALIGPNGSGKSTLLSVIAGRQWPTAGRVEILGHRLGRVDLRELRARLGLHSATLARQLRPRLSAHDVVVTGLDGNLEPWWRSYPDDAHERADALLASVGLADARERQVGVLSEGERARLLLARVLMAEPGLLCLDEPAAGLDLGAREELLDRLGAIAASSDPAPMLLVTHHLEELPSGMTHAIVLSSGRPLSFGAIDDVLRSEVVSEAFGIEVVVERHEGGRFSARAIRRS